MSRTEPAFFFVSGRTHRYFALTGNLRNTQNPCGVDNNLTQTAQTYAEACETTRLSAECNYILDRSIELAPQKMRVEITTLQTPVFLPFIRLLYRRTKITYFSIRTKMRRMEKYVLLFFCLKQSPEHTAGLVVLCTLFFVL